MRTGGGIFMCDHFKGFKGIPEDPWSFYIVFQDYEINTERLDHIFRDLEWMVDGQMTGSLPRLQASVMNLELDENSKSLFMS